MDLGGRQALVTGGSRGIGAQVARALAQAGARVTVLGRSQKELAQVAAEIGGVAIAVDLADRGDTDRALHEIAQQTAVVDILVNNAGIAESAALADTTDAAWDQMFAVNVTATMRLTRALLPAMVKKGWGRVINIASNAGLTGYQYSSAYCASKHAVVGFTRALAMDIARTGVTVNAVCPGWVETQLAQDAVERIARKTGRSQAESRAALVAMTPQRRMITPDEVAFVVTRLCADQARGIHGQALVVDGGQVLK
jgi:NAD(P)-dependent dehydrogenase (short-subunit alcohol dehydrogenase family)